MSSSKTPDRQRVSKYYTACPHLSNSSSSSQYYDNSFAMMPSSSRVRNKSAVGMAYPQAQNESSPVAQRRIIDHARLHEIQNDNASLYYRLQAIAQDRSPENSLSHRPIKKKKESPLVQRAKSRAGSNSNRHYSSNTQSDNLGEDESTLFASIVRSPSSRGIFQSGEEKDYFDSHNNSVMFQNSSSSISNYPSNQNTIMSNSNSSTIMHTHNNYQNQQQQQQYQHQYHQQQQQQQQQYQNSPQLSHQHSQSHYNNYQQQQSQSHLHYQNEGSNSRSNSISPKKRVRIDPEYSSERAPKLPSITSKQRVVEQCTICKECNPQSKSQERSLRSIQSARRQSNLSTCSHCGCSTLHESPSKLRGCFREVEEEEGMQQPAANEFYTIHAQQQHTQRGIDQLAGVQFVDERRRLDPLRHRLLCLKKQGNLSPRILPTSLM